MIRALHRRLNAFLQLHSTPGMLSSFVTLFPIPRPLTRRITSIISRSTNINTDTNTNTETINNYINNTSRTSSCHHSPAPRRLHRTTQPTTTATFPTRSTELRSPARFPTLLASPRPIAAPSPDTGPHHLHNQNLNLILEQNLTCCRGHTRHPIRTHKELIGAPTRPRLNALDCVAT